jgi:hypothetical protein
LHVDTTWKFREMYDFRDKMVAELDVDLLVYRNPECERLGISPFTHGSAVHTDMWKTEGLKQALDLYRFDVAFGGARRDEEKSRAKERIFSVRTAQHRWDAKQQRPELWQLYNVRKNPGESIRVFPLSNWTLSAHSPDPDDFALRGSRLEGEVALVVGGGVTGGYPGTGSAMARLFAAQGAKVVVIGRTVEHTEKTVAQIEQAGHEAVAVAGDTTRAGDCERAVSAAVERYGRLDNVAAHKGVSVDNFDEGCGTRSSTATSWRRW